MTEAQRIDPPVDPELEVGARVGRFVVETRVATGGMGALYRAHDPELDRIVALKVVRASRAGARGESGSSERLLREAKVLAKLAHPNIVAVFDAGQVGDGVFIAMEFVSGVTLREWAKGEHGAEARVAKMMDAGRGLAAAHAAGLVHRDFKPDNVIVGSDGRVRVVDFGLAREAGAPDPNALWTAEDERPSASMPAADAPLTRAGALLGTPRYMAPEQLLGLGVDARTDQFSFAVTFFEVLFGQLPFTGATWGEFASRVTSGVFVFPPRPRAPRALRRLLARALDPVPARRFASMDDLLAALDRFRHGGRRRLEIAGALVASLVVAGFAFAHRSGEDLCPPDATALMGVWDGGVRAAVIRAFAATEVAGASASADRVAQKLDAFVHDWSAMRVEVCRATRVRKEQPEDVQRLRNDCLDRERTEVRSVTTMLASADAQVVQRALDVAYGLPQPSWCADVSTLRASAGLPDDPAKRAKVIAVRAQLADARSKELAGKLEEAQGRAEDAVAAARAIDHAPTIADVLVFTGTVHGHRGDFDGEVPMLREGLLVAQASGVDSIVVRAAGILAFVTGAKLQRPDEAHVWLDLARATLRRMGGSEELELELLEHEASITIEVDGRPERAIPIQTRIVAAYERTRGASPSTVVALDNLGDAYASLGDPARARAPLEQAVAMSASVGGPTYPGLGTSQQLLGQVETDLGESARGKAHLEGALAIFEANRMPYWSALATERLAALALESGDGTAAIERADRALGYLHDARSAADIVPTVDVTAGLAYVATDSARALELCDAALAEEEKESALDPDKVYGWDALRCKAEALMTMGRSAEAIPLLERSLGLKKRSFRGEYARAEFALARALLLAGRDPARAVSLARAARDELSGLSPSSVELRHVDAWLARQGQKVR